MKKIKIKNKSKNLSKNDYKEKEEYLYNCCLENYKMFDTKPKIIVQLVDDIDEIDNTQGAMIPKNKNKYFLLLKQDMIFHNKIYCSL